MMMDTMEARATAGQQDGNADAGTTAAGRVDRRK